MEKDKKILRVNIDLNLKKKRIKYHEKMLKNKNRRKSSKNGFKIQQKWMKSADTWITYQKNCEKWV